MGWVLPVGTPGGINAGIDGQPDGSGTVRLGNEFFCLEPDIYRLWVATASTPAVRDVLEWASQEAITDAELHLRDLDDAGLLISESGFELCAHTTAMRLIGEILGNGTEPTARFVVRGNNGVLVAVDPYCYDLMLRIDGVSPISVYLDSADRVREKHAHGRAAQALMADLPQLVRARIVRLDAAMPSGGGT
jgi:hypothetical protein